LKFGLTNGRGEAGNAQETGGGGVQIRVPKADEAEVRIGKKGSYWKAVSRHVLHSDHILLQGHKPPRYAQPLLAISFVAMV